MRIYGQTPGEIFSKLPWQYRIFVAISALFILFVAAYVPTRVAALLAKAKPAPEKPAPLRIDNAAAGSVFDPALAFDPQTNTAWLAYAAVSPSPDDEGALVGVRLASSSGNKCARWESAPGGFDSKSDSLYAPDGQTVFRTGVWRVETPSLVYDPDDPGKEWKLYAYKYFWAKDPASVLQVAEHYGVIVYKYAHDPAQGWSNEQWLFSPMADYPPPPYEQMVALHLDSLDPSLKDVVAYARPSVIYKDGALVMSLSAFTGGETPDRIVMFLSRDHGQSWAYAGTPLAAADLPGVGPYTTLAGATLIEQQGKVYLAAALGNGRQYGQGTFIFGFADLFKGQLAHDPVTQAPLLLRAIPLSAPAGGPLGGGFAAYSDACPFGLLTGEQVMPSQTFQILRTYQLPAGK